LINEYKNNQNSVSLRTRVRKFRDKTFLFRLI
jgi:hypothetical protein